MGKVTKTFVDGQPLTAADLNSIKNGVNALYADERNEVTDAPYYEMFDVNGNPVKVSKASAAAMVADVIKSNPDLQAKVTFGAVDSAGLASVVAQKIHDSADSQKLVTFGASDAAGLASVVAGQAYYKHAYKGGTSSKWTRIAKVKLTAGDFCNVNIVAGWAGSAHYALLSVNIYKNPNNVYLHHKISLQSTIAYKMKYAIEDDCFVIYELPNWDHANCSINYTLGKDVQQVFEATSLTDSDLNDFV